MTEKTIGSAKNYNELEDRLSGLEYRELQTAIRTILRLTVGKVDGPTRVPCVASLTFMIEHGDPKPLSITLRTLD